MSRKLTEVKADLRLSSDLNLYRQKYFKPGEFERFCKSLRLGRLMNEWMALAYPVNFPKTPTNYPTKLPSDIERQDKTTNSSFDNYNSNMESEKIPDNFGLSRLENKANIIHNELIKSNANIGNNCYHNTVHNHEEVEDPYQAYTDHYTSYTSSPGHKSTSMEGTRCLLYKLRRRIPKSLRKFYPCILDNNSVRLFGLNPSISRPPDLNSFLLNSNLNRLHFLRMNKKQCHTQEQTSRPNMNYIDFKIASSSLNFGTGLREYDHNLDGRFDHLTTSKIFRHNKTEHTSNGLKRRFSSGLDHCKTFSTVNRKPLSHSKIWSLSDQNIKGQISCIDINFVPLSNSEQIKAILDAIIFLKKHGDPYRKLIITVDWIPSSVSTRFTDYTHLKIDCIGFYIPFSNLERFQDDSARFQDYVCENGLYFQLNFDQDNDISLIKMELKSLFHPINNINNNIQWCCHDTKTFLHIFGQYNINIQNPQTLFDTAIVTWLFNPDLHTQSLFKIFSRRKNQTNVFKDFQSDDSHDLPHKADHNKELMPPELRDLLVGKFGRFGWGIYTHGKKLKPRKNSRKSKNAEILQDIESMSFSHLSSQQVTEFEPITLQNQQEFSKKIKSKAISLIKLNDKTKYLQSRCVALYEVFIELEKELQKWQPQKLIWERIEMPLINTLYEVEKRGIRLDPDKLQEITAHLPSYEVLLTEFNGLTHTEINPFSPKQLSELLYDKLGFTPVNSSRLKDGSNSRSTDNQSLIALSQQISNFDLEGQKKRERLLDILKVLRSLMKMLSTYVNRLPLFINPETKRVHCHFLQTGTSTGRLSCECPNLQQIPSKSPYSKYIKAAFVPVEANSIPNQVAEDFSRLRNSLPEWKFVSFDYKQMELYILAYLSHDFILKDALNSSDTFVTMASNLFKCPIEEVTQEMRNSAKTTTYGIIYGQTEQGLSRRLRISRDEAAQLISTFFGIFPFVKLYLDFQIQWAEKFAYTQTLIGRRRLIVSKGNTQRRIAMNTPIQGFAADIIKFVSNKISQELSNRRNLNSADQVHAALILQIHDELLFEAQDDHCEKLIKVVKPIMENAWNNILSHMDCHKSYELTYKKFLLDQSRLNILPRIAVPNENRHENILPVKISIGDSWSDR